MSRNLASFSLRPYSSIDSINNVIYKFNKLYQGNLIIIAEY